MSKILNVRFGSGLRLKLAESVILAAITCAGLGHVANADTDNTVGMRESATDLTYSYEVSCVVRNLRGAEYVGRAGGEYAMDRACHYAFDQCYRDSILPRTCHIVYQGPGFTGDAADSNNTGCKPEIESSCMVPAPADASQP